MKNQIYIAALFFLQSAYGITISLTDNTLSPEHDGYAFFLKEDFATTGHLETIKTNHYPNLETIFETQEFTGKKKSSYSLTSMLDTRLVTFMFHGVGNLENPDHESMEIFRRATGDLVKASKSHNLNNVTLYLPASGHDFADLVKQMSIAAHLADYEFNTLKNDSDKHALSLFIACDNPEDESLQRALAEAEIIAEMTNNAREWGNLPANIMSPRKLASEARRLAQETGCSCTVLDEEDARQLGMGGFIAVGQGAASDSKFIIVQHKATNPYAPTIALIGKGVIFDAGGIDIKHSWLTEMKYDMCGGAAVLATIFAAAKLGADVNIVALVPAVENLLGANAYRPSDVITFMNGKTAEIKNTDAEGRLIMADALCYAEKFYNPDVMIDVATLTGACIFALGHFYAGLMTRDDKLCDDICAAARRSGDNVWRLPLHDDYIPALDSDYGDFSNLGKTNYYAGATTAGHFLENFVETTPWVHLDIASTAFEVPGISYLHPAYGTGAGVRLLVDYIMNYNK